MTTITKSNAFFLDKDYTGYIIDGISYFYIHDIFDSEEKAWKCFEKLDSKCVKFINPNDLLIYDAKPTNVDTQLLVSWEGLLERLTK